MFSHFDTLEHTALYEQIYSLNTVLKDANFTIEISAHNHQESMAQYMYWYN